MKILRVQSLKAMTDHLFTKASFDSFYFLNGKIQTFLTYQLDGTYFPEYDGEDGEVPPPYAPWGRVRSFFFEAMKGKKLPLSFRIFLAAFDKSTRAFEKENELEEGSISSLSMSFQFHNKELRVSFAVNHKDFTLDRTAETIWDNYGEELLKGLGVELSPLEEE